jgi:hypothetical protein
MTSATVCRIRAISWQGEWEGVDLTLLYAFIEERTGDLHPQTSLFDRPYAGIHVEGYEN